MTSWTDYQDDISDAISDSMDVDWSASVGARAVVAWLNEHKPLATREEAPACEMCNGRGEVGGPTGQTAESFDYVTERCPDCGGTGKFEAPAEAGERDVIAREVWIGFTGNQNVWDRAKDTDNETAKYCWATADRILALRAQPQAREEAQPVGYAHASVLEGGYGHTTLFEDNMPRLHDLALYTTPPAPEAEKLRVAVEALEEFSREYDGFEDGNGDPCPTLAKARLAIAALQQEGKA